MKNNKQLRNARLAVLLVIGFIVLTIQVLSAPVGPQITYISNETSAAAGGSALRSSDEGGYITTMNLDAAQQNYAWKAYVGNVTGGLALKDQDNYSIYSWPISAAEQEVYISRNDSIDWASVNCSNSSIKLAEDTFLGINSSQSKSVNRTFNGSTHKGFDVAGRAMSNCFAIATYLNNTAQTSGASNYFQEVLLADQYSNLVYAALVDADTLGFDEQSYDFQAIVAEDELLGPTAYYFYVELA